MLKVYADKQGKAVFNCPHCGFVTNFDASAYRNRDSRIKIKCRCGESMVMLVEFREYYRRAVSLIGTCSVHRTGKDMAMKVRDLSLSGLSFSLESSQEDQEALQVGDVITVRFRLDAPPESFIQRKASVRNIRGDAIGARFSRSEYDKELGFYLLH
ncbi:MAG: hypothetical protein CVU60_14625 [Deltaproteobacteria bacterium HGW-Deltaproteobacteria-18]|jgi:uncharacterized Zn finger protein|nr:MAG: hypothetical protein CVU60_14625 [Deltaproteobacteria bacterium HGW-Deltaproteobacteria-18]